MEENKKKFEYRYSAPTEAERREIAAIRRQYLPQGAPEGGIEELRRLNGRVTGLATALSLAVGVIGLLIFGLGLTMVLEWGLTLWGIIVGVLGLFPIGAAYPVYRVLYAAGKKKYGPRILQLSEELIGKDAE